MATVHNINGVLSALRGDPMSSIDAYGRVLSKEGVISATKRGAGAASRTTTDAALLLIAVLRGSPIAAATNAREVGGLIVRGDSFDQVLAQQLAALAWPQDMTFAKAVAWFIDRHVDGTADQFILNKSVKITIDRYWTSASIAWSPTRAINDAYLKGWAEAMPDFDTGALTKADGNLLHPMTITFASPLLYQAKVSYGRDKEANRTAHRKFQSSKDDSMKFDRWGNETVTERTLIALSEIFKDDKTPPSKKD